MKQQVLSNYAKAVEAGAYDRHSPNLFGKHDRVRRHWEDRYIRRLLSPIIRGLMERKEGTAKGIRVLDMGCGAGEGLDILTTLPLRIPTLDVKVNRVLGYEDIEHYKGADISPAMIAKAKALHTQHSQTEFVVADLNDGLPISPGEAPYDVYFSSYAALSHLKDDGFKQLVENICQHMGDRAILVADLLGRYSYEWQCYWGESDSQDIGMQDYSMSYIYPPEARSRDDIEHFPMRYWGADENYGFIKTIAEAKGVKIGDSKLCDRSLMVGRHMDTHEYNPKSPALRVAVNSLIEPNSRTDLKELIFNYHPHPNHPYLNRFFNNLQTSWNAIVYSCMEALNQWHNPEELLKEPEIEHPPVVLDAVRTIRHLVRQAPTFQFEDPLANLVEPQLAYLLRDLEWNIQPGLGAGHSLLAVYELYR